MNSRHFLYILYICVLMLGASLCGCKHEKVWRIGVSQCSQDDWRTKINEEIIREAMFHDNVEVEIRSADDSSDKQINDIRYFADNGFDIIIVSPNEAAPLTPVIKDVYESGLPVIIFDRNIEGDTYTARIGADDVGLGRSAANYAQAMLGSGLKAIEICGLPGSTPAEGRKKGFNETFTAAGNRVLASVPGNWNKEDAVRAADSLLKVLPDVDLIYAHNDRMAIGASEVARSLGRSDIKIIGIDAAPNIGVKAVADGVIDATFLYPTEGHRLVLKALEILNGEPYERETILPTTSVVDASNADLLLLQYEAIKDETNKMETLKAKFDDYWARHSSQTLLFYASIVIIILLTGVVFLVLRAFWQRRRQNKILEEQRDRERELNEKLKEATSAKLMFFTNVSHDLRTPLTLISEPVAQLAEADNLTSRQQNLIKIADKNVRILRRLINQILDFRKYDNDKMRLDLVEVDISRCISDWLESFNALAKKRHMKLSAEIDCPTPALMAVDIEKIERVMFNLISNAFKYTPDNGEIRVRLSFEHDNAVISVSDTGQGISERDLGNIFDLFYQVDQVHPHGSGIGLSLSKAFVELHGGTLEVESELKKGSVFRITLPVRHVADSATETQSLITSEDVEAELGAIDEDAEFDQSKPLLLIIDDNRDIQHLVEELMQPHYNVITASGGSEGIRKAVKYVPDLIICDVMMPGIDGYECCRRLKEEVSTSHIPVLMLTACTMDEQRVQGYECGADGYMSKPFSASVLQARCASLIENRKRIQQLWSQSSKETPAPQASRPQTKPAGDIDNDFYRRFLEIFTAEISNSDLSVDALASKMGLERTQFYRKIKALTNFSPVELMRNLRLKHARHLLKTSDRSVSEIAYDCGFSTPAYFTRCYREAFDETPSETRSKLR